MSFEVIIVFVLIIGFVGLYWAIQRLLGQRTERVELEKIVEQVFGKSASLITEQSRTVLHGESSLLTADLAHRHKNMADMVDSVKKDLEKRQDEIRSLEQDRVKKFTELVTSLEQQQKLTSELQVSTQKLTAVLANNQARGQWGERIIEDLLQSNGLLEGVHYARQQPLVGTEFRPDITLLLPNKRFVAVDVKFPFSEVQSWATTENKQQQALILKQFVQNIKGKIDKVAEYIVPAANTLDYAVLFVPNEMIFSLLNQKTPEIIEYALEKRVLLVSPFTFLIVARTVLESYRNFMISDSLRAAAGQIDAFVSEWDKFKTHFEKYGRTLQTLQGDYETLTTTRVRQMERRIEKVQQIRQGNSGLSASEQELLPDNE